MRTCPKCHQWSFEYDGNASAWRCLRTDCDYSEPDPGRHGKQSCVNCGAQRARTEVAEKKLADVMAKSAELYEEGKRIAHASEAIVRRAEAAEKDADTWKRRAELLMERHRGAAFHAFLCCHPQKSFDKRKHLEAASVRSAFRAIRDHLNGSRTWERCEACQHEAKVQQSQGDTPFPETSVVWERLDAAVEGEEVEQDG